MYRVTIEAHFLDTQAIRRQSGLEAMLGGALGLADVLSPEQGYSTLLSARTGIVCQECMLDSKLAQLLEKSDEED